MATITSVELFLSRTSNRTGWNLHVDIHGVELYTVNPTQGDILGSKIIVVDTIPVNGSQDWVTFTFDSPITINNTGFYSIHLWGDTSDYQMTGVRWYDSDGTLGWLDATTGPPYAATERFWSGSPWSASGTGAYRINCSGCDDNSAEFALGTYTLGGGSISKGMGIRTYLDAGTAPTKATNPSPANNATDKDFSGLQLSWDDGGGADTFNIYIGETGNLTAFLPAQAGTTFTVTMAELEAVFGTDPIEQKIYWRIDSTNDAGTTTGDEWNFDPRPVKASDPFPANTATDAAVSFAATWTGSDIASTFNTLVDVGSGLVSQSTGLESATWTADPNIFDYTTQYTWRVDSVNAFGTTEGDEWTFTTIRLDPPGRTYFYLTTGQYYYLLIQSDGTYGDPPGVGVENTDYVYLAAGYEHNAIATTRKLIAAAENRIWYEDI